MQRILDLIRPLIRRLTRSNELQPMSLAAQAYWRDSCRIMTRNVCAMLRLTEEPLTPENIIAFIASLPLSHYELRSWEWRSSYCYRCLQKGNDITDGSECRPQFLHLLWYFADEFVKESDFHKQDLLSAVLGTLGGLTLDGEPVQAHGAALCKTS